MSLIFILYTLLFFVIFLTLLIHSFVNTFLTFCTRTTPFTHKQGVQVVRLFFFNTKLDYLLLIPLHSLKGNELTALYYTLLQQLIVLLFITLREFSNKEFTTLYFIKTTP